MTPLLSFLWKSNLWAHLVDLIRKMIFEQQFLTTFVTTFSLILTFCFYFLSMWWIYWWFVMFCRYWVFLYWFSLKSFRCFYGILWVLVFIFILFLFLGWFFLSWIRVLLLLLSCHIWCSFYLNYLSIWVFVIYTDLLCHKIK